jgi:hypothetical protein
MVDLKKYHDRLQKKIGEAMSADKILEGPWWNVVIKDLNLMSYYFARGLELQIKSPVEKRYTDGTLAYNLPYEEWPPMRLMALNLILSYWLGWMSPTHGPNEGLQWIQGTYNTGLNDFLQSDEGKKWLQTPQGKEWQQHQEQQQQGQQVASRPCETEAGGTQQSNAKTEEKA